MVENEWSVLWFKQTDKFKEPKADIKLWIYKSKEFEEGNVKYSIFCSMWNSVMEEIFRELTYMANCANISFEVSNSKDILSFGVSGYDETLDTFLFEAMS